LYIKKIASAFFVTYEYLKKELGNIFPDTKYLPFIHMVSASGGEVASILNFYLP
jgi:solute carrier family 25 S-adenosylmethionine transporter 26